MVRNSNFTAWRWRDDQLSAFLARQYGPQVIWDILQDLTWDQLEMQPWFPAPYRAVQELNAEPWQGDAQFGS